MHLLRALKHPQCSSGLVCLRILPVCGCDGVVGLRRHRGLGTVRQCWFDLWWGRGQILRWTVVVVVDLGCRYRVRRWDRLVRGHQMP